MAKFGILFTIAAAATLVVATFPMWPAEAQTNQLSKCYLQVKSTHNMQRQRCRLRLHMNTLAYECFEQYDKFLYAMEPFTRRCCDNLQALEEGCHEELKRVQMAMPWSENDYEEKSLNKLDGCLWWQCEHSQDESIRL